MAKQLACALTHVRHEGVFLEKWLEHYGAVVGRENLHVVIDGDDWSPDVDLSGVHVEVVLGAPRQRIRNDRWIAKEMSSRANRLRKTYRFVIRGDVDEYVAVDPSSGLSWEQALETMEDDGYVFALGVDVIQGADERTPVDPRRPFLDQRSRGFVADRYTKPFVISRWNNWSGGAHRLLNRPVRIDPAFVLFHMALSDEDIAADRLAARGGTAQHKSFVDHQVQRKSAIGTDVPALPWDEACMIALRDFPVERDGSPAPRPRPTGDPRAVEHGLPVVIPERFRGLA